MGVTRVVSCPYSLSNFPSQISENFSCLNALSRQGPDLQYIKWRRAGRVCCYYVPHLEKLTYVESFFFRLC